MIGKKLQDAINSQIQAETYSAYLYLAMSTACASKGLTGFANWLHVQYQEETFHAQKFIDYVVSRGGEVRLLAIDAPPYEFGTPLDIFKKVLEHEEYVTSLINKLYEVALETKDFAGQIFLQWYINEQVEEEGNVTAILEKLKVVGDKTEAILYIDKELSTRVYVPPVATNGN